MRLPDIITDRTFHDPKDVARVFAYINHQPVQKDASRSSTLARRFLTLGVSLYVAAEVISAATPLVKDTINEMIAADNEVFKRTKSPLYKYQEFPPVSGTENDLQATALDEYLRERIGENFQILKSEEQLIAQSIILDSNNKPLGHWFYEVPIRDLKYRRLTKGPATGPTYDSLEYGKEAPPTSYWVMTPGKNGYNSVWLAVPYTDPQTNRLAFKFANDLDADDPTRRWSFSYRRETPRDGEKTRYNGGQLFPVDVIMPPIRPAGIRHLGQIF